MPFALFSRHPDYRLRAAWEYAQLGLLFFPLIPSLGILGLIAATVSTWQQKYKQIIYHPLNWGLALLAIWLIVTTGFAFDRWAAFLGLFNFLPFFAFFAAFSVLIQTPAQLRQIASILVATSIPVVIVGLGQMFLGLTSPTEWQSFLGWIIAPYGNPTGRMSSIFNYANILAGYLVVVFTLGLGLWIATFKERRHEKRTSTIHPSSRLFLGLVVIGNLIALILTNSRNAWAIAAGTGLAFAFYQGWLWLLAAVAGMIGSVTWAAFGPPPVQQWLRTVVPAFFWARLTDQLYPNRPIPLLRVTQWQFAWSMSQQRPMTGWGLRNFTLLYEGQMHVWLGHPHNFFLMLTSETGIPFTLLFCSWVAWILFKGIQLLITWSSIVQLNGYQLAQDRLILFSYLVAFAACIIFNMADVTVFDLRLNTLTWLLLSGICGVAYNWHAHKYSSLTSYIFKCN